MRFAGRLSLIAPMSFTPIAFFRTVSSCFSLDSSDSIGSLLVLPAPTVLGIASFLSCSVEGSDELSLTVDVSELADEDWFWSVEIDGDMMFVWVWV
uniref:Uncharacterized protein n=1 Tax=Phakopsora pachyrhizi TaxID=170000 RepID=A0A0S1MIN2_PHAPC